MIVGIMPGAGGSIASLIGWSEAKRWSKNKDDFGKGTLEGVAASESANNADIQGALVPTLALGIPGSVSATLMLSALILHGLRPGPLLFTQRPDVVYGLFGGLFLSNIFLLIIGFFIIKSAIKIINTNPPFLLSTILIIIVTGVFKINHEIFDIIVALIFGFLGIIMNKYKFSTAALSLGIVLGQLFEISFRQALTISSGDPLIFINRPISLFLIVLSVITLSYPIIFKKKK
jgi:putative tricarboxylic transport membrane protein